LVFEGAGEGAETRGERAVGCEGEGCEGEGGLDGD